MKKIFSFFAALLMAGSMMAQAFDHGLYVPANASVEALSEVGTTATLDATTGDLTINIGGQHTSWSDWGNQIKLTTGITAMDASKNYEIGFKAVASTANCPASHVKFFDDNELFHSTEEVYTTTVKEFSTVVHGVAATNGIIVWSFTWADAQTVTISDIYVKESSVEEHPQAVDECAGEHGLYDADAATINSTYFATVNWAGNPGCYAEISNGVITMHVDQYFADMWQGQVFVDPGFTFTPGKMYHYEFDVVSTGKVGMTVKVNDNDDDAFYKEEIYDFNIGGGTYHFSTDSVIATDKLAQTGKGPLVFGFGWTDGNQDVIIKCIKITEIGDAPKPEEKHMYIKHPWGTGANEDWTWQEMAETKYNTMDAWTYTGAWGGVGFNIANNAEGTDAKWFAADAIQFLDAAERIIVSAPAVGTEGCEFIYVPVLDNGNGIPCSIVLVPTQTGLHDVEATEVVKLIENGQVVIIRNGVKYNAVGVQL